MGGSPGGTGCQLTPSGAPGTRARLPVPASGTAARRTRRGDATTALIGALFVALLVVGGALALDGPDPRPDQVLPVLGTAALYLAAGLLAWRRRPHNRIGVLLLLTGLSIWLTALARRADAVPGRPSRSSRGTMPLALTLHLILAYPSGRVEGRLARVLVGLGYLRLLAPPAARACCVGDGPAAVWDPPGAAVDRASGELGADDGRGVLGARAPRRSWPSGSSGPTRSSAAGSGRWSGTGCSCRCSSPSARSAIQAGWRPAG